MTYAYLILWVGTSVASVLVVGAVAGWEVAPIFLSLFLSFAATVLLALGEIRDEIHKRAGR